MADTVVERLAAKWGGNIDDGSDIATHESDSRWWLNAIADEGRRRFNHGSGTAQDVWDWLQEQAR